MGAEKIAAQVSSSVRAAVSAAAACSMSWSSHQGSPARKASTDSAHSWSRSRARACTSIVPTGTGQKRRWPVWSRRYSCVGRSREDAAPRLEDLGPAIGRTKPLLLARQKGLDHFEIRPVHRGEFAELDDPLAAQAWEASLLPKSRSPSKNQSAPASFLNADDFRTPWSPSRIRTRSALQPGRRRPRHG